MSASHCISDPADPDLLAMPFDVEGFPLKRTVWIEKGVLRNLSYTRFWAQQPEGAADRHQHIRWRLQRDWAAG